MMNFPMVFSLGGVEFERVRDDIGARAASSIQRVLVPNVQYPAHFNVQRPVSLPNGVPAAQHTQDHTGAPLWGEGSACPGNPV